MPGMKKLLALALASLWLAAPALAKTQVVATITILADMARNIGGDAVDVTSLVGPDGDAHVYEPTPADVQTLARAQVLIVNGLGLEGWMERLGDAAGFKGAKVTVTTGIKARKMEEDGKTVTDPHAWQDLANGLIYVRNIADGLCKADASHCDQFMHNAASYSDALRALDDEVRAEIATVPPAKRIVVTTHDAFGYFAAAYGVKFLAAQGIGTEAEATVAGLAALTRQIKANHVTALFFENMSDTRLMASIARETGVSPGPPLYADALSPPAGPASTYVDMFKYNVPQLVKAMAGN
jgi:zinc/manganese transport system substrate-binding protein